MSSIKTLVSRVLDLKWEKEESVCSIDSLCRAIARLLSFCGNPSPSHAHISLLHLLLLKTHCEASRGLRRLML